MGVGTVEGKRISVHRVHRGGEESDPPRPSRACPGAPGDFVARPAFPVHAHRQVESGVYRVRQNQMARV